MLFLPGVYPSQRCQIPEESNPAKKGENVSPIFLESPLQEKKNIAFITSSHVLL